MPALLEKITRDLSKKGIEPRSAEAKAFIQKMIGQAKIPTNRSNVLNDPKRTAPFAVVGKMFMFRYDPLTKEKPARRIWRTRRNSPWSLSRSRCIRFRWCWWCNRSRCRYTWKHP